MKNMYEKYLPIGTVVMLKNGRKKLMITGFCTMTEAEKGKVYDYSGCLYPEGFIKSNQFFLFNHDDIDKIHHIGLIDEDETKFKDKLEKLLEEKLRMKGE